jgi:hypothetical protein
MCKCVAMRASIQCEGPHTSCYITIDSSHKSPVTSSAKHNYCSTTASVPFMYSHASPSAPFCLNSTRMSASLSTMLDTPSAIPGRGRRLGFHRPEYGATFDKHRDANTRNNSNIENSRSAYPSVYKNQCLPALEYTNAAEPTFQSRTPISLVAA